MTYEEARKYLLQNYFDGDENTKAVTDCDCETEAMKIAIEALEKQIPKKQNRSQYCTICGTFNYSYRKYCINCGQALDWGEEE